MVFSTLMTIRSFYRFSSFSFFILSFDAQKKVPKKREATAKRPHSRHALTPEGIIFYPYSLLKGVAIPGRGRSPQSRSAAPEVYTSGPRCIASRTYIPSSIHSTGMQYW